MLCTLRKQSAIFLVVVSLLWGFVLSGCDGTAVIDVNVDPDTGQGNIVVSGDDEGGDVDVNVDDNSNADTSQILLFGIVVALLLGTVAIVVSTSRRDRG